MTARSGRFEQRVASCLEALRSGDFRAFQGLPEAWPSAELIAALDAHASPPGRRRLAGRTRDFRVLERADGPPLELFEEDGQVMLLAISLPRFDPPLPEQLTALGAPAAKSLTHDAGDAIADGEWVWPRRGLAIFLDPEELDPFHLTLFAPCSLRQYRRTLQRELREREYPED